MMPKTEINRGTIINPPPTPTYPEASPAHKPMAKQVSTLLGFSLKAFGFSSVSATDCFEFVAEAFAELSAVVFPGPPATAGSTLDIASAAAAAFSASFSRSLPVTADFPCGGIFGIRIALRNMDTDEYPIIRAAANITAHEGEIEARYTPTGLVQAPPMPHNKPT